MRAQYLGENADRPLRLTGDGQVKWLDYKNIIYSTSVADPDPLESEPFRWIRIWIRFLFIFTKDL